MSSYLTLERGTPVVDRFGAPVGKVERVLTITGGYFGGLTADELGDRFEAAYEARTLDELQRLSPVTK